MSGQTYRIGEAATLLNLKTYVLRFWETEFPQIVPLRTEKGQRLYTEADLAVLRRIRYLLHERGLTIEGARRILAEEDRRSSARQAQASLLPEEETAGQDTEDEMEPDTLDRVLQAELCAVEAGRAAESMEAGLPEATVLRECIAELQNIRRLLNPGPEQTV